MTDEALQARMDEEMAALYDESRLKTGYLMLRDGSLTACGWLTVTAPAGGKGEADCKAFGVTFRALDGVVVPPEPGRRIPTPASSAAGTAPAISGRDSSASCTESSISSRTCSADNKPR